MDIIVSDFQISERLLRIRLQARQSIPDRVPQDIEAISERHAADSYLKGTQAVPVDPLLQASLFQGFGQQVHRAAE